MNVCKKAICRYGWLSVKVNEIYEWPNPRLRKLQKPFNAWHDVIMYSYLKMITSGVRCLIASWKLSTSML